MIMIIMIKVLVSKSWDSSKPSSDAWIKKGSYV